MVRLELERRHGVMMAAVGLTGSSPVLDLGRADHRNVLRHALDYGLDDGQAGSYGAVVSVAGLARFADLGAALSVVVDLLAPDGVLMAVEPGFRPGAMALVAASLGALLPPARGVHLARDLPATVRSTAGRSTTGQTSAGRSTTGQTTRLTVTDVERFTMPTLIWPLRSFVQLRAERIGAPLPQVQR